MAKTIEPWEITAWALGELEPERQAEVGAWLEQHPEELAAAEQARVDLKRILGRMADPGAAGGDLEADLDERRLAELAEEVERIGRRGTGVAGRLAYWRSWSWGDASMSWNLHWGLAAALIAMVSVTAIVLVMIWQGLGGELGGEGTGAGRTARGPVDQPRPAESAALMGERTRLWNELWTRHADRLPPRFDAARSLWPAVEPVTADLASALGALGRVEAFGWSDAESGTSGRGARLYWEQGAASIAAAAREQSWRSGTVLSVPAAYATWDVTGMGAGNRTELSVEGQWAAGIKRVRLEGDGRGVLFLLELQHPADFGSDEPRAGSGRLRVLMVLGREVEPEAWAAFCRAVMAVGSLVSDYEDASRIEIAIVNGEQSGWIAHSSLVPDFEKTYDRLMDLTPAGFEPRLTVLEQWLGSGGGLTEMDEPVRRVVLGTDRACVEAVFEGLETRDKTAIKTWWPRNSNGVTKSSNFEPMLGSQGVSRQGQSGGRWFESTDREPVEEVVLELCGRPSAPALFSGWALELRFGPQSRLDLAGPGVFRQIESAGLMARMDGSGDGSSQNVGPAGYSPAMIARTDAGWIVAVRLEAAGEDRRDDLPIPPLAVGAADSEPVLVVLRPLGVSPGAGEAADSELAWALPVRNVEFQALSDAERWLAAMTYGAEALTAGDVAPPIESAERWLSILLDLGVDRPAVRRQSASAVRQWIIEPLNR